jgi:hypothetical protein
VNWPRGHSVNLHLAVLVVRSLETIWCAARSCAEMRRAVLGCLARQLKRKAGAPALTRPSNLPEQRGARRAPQKPAAVAGGRGDSHGPRFRL